MLNKLIFLFAVLICAQANTQDNAPMYLINEARFNELLARLQAPSLTETKTTFIKATTGTFVFTCKQVWALLSCYGGETNKLEGLDALRANIDDPQHKQAEILDKFISSDSKKKATDLLANIVPCKHQGVAPEKLPVLEIPYTSQWSDSEFEELITKLKSFNWSADKLTFAIQRIMSKSNGISSTQTVTLFKQFGFTKDMLTLAESVKDRIMGITCEQLKDILSVFGMSDDKIEALKAFKNSLTDVENKFSVLDAFSMSSYKEKARKILEDLKPKSHLFGVPEGKVAFLLDYSGSMSTSFVLNTGQKSTRLDFVKSEFAKTVTNFDEKIEFDVFCYAERVLAWKPNLQVATQAAIPQAIAFTKQFPANGGTNIYEALRTGWNTPNVETIYLLTDGTPSVGAKIHPDAILNDVRTWMSKKPIKVHTIAFLMGTEKWDNKPASRNFMKAIAEATGGTYRAIESDK